MSSSRDLLDKLDLAKALSPGSLQDHRLKLLDALGHRIIDELEEARTKEEQCENLLEVARHKKTKYELELQDTERKLLELKRRKRLGMVVSALFIVGTIIALVYFVFGQPPPGESIPCTSLAIEGFMIAGQPVAPGSIYQASVNLNEADVAVEAKLKTEPSDCDFDTKWRVNDEDGEYLSVVTNTLTLDLPIPPINRKRIVHFTVKDIISNDARSNYFVIEGSNPKPSEGEAP